jgi:hypothetical protein
LIFKAKIAYHKPMQSGLSPRLRRMVSGIMLLAMAAFVQQGTVITMSQAAAALGFMPHPAVLLHGPAHVHDNLAGHVHAHGGDHAVGHVHHGADPDDDHADDIGNAPFWSLGSTTAFIFAPGPWTPPLSVGIEIECLPDNRLDGIEPDGLSRPPSIPSIA